ncbi:hypothetical protein VTN77DRAFT_7177 [Rasamsonia byssochlamydoides]|uniref:uncharacterized protein n=1 Tax=Rasamsonia byssochlamydoides TaxID=89139 RepID=UPI003743735B
MVSFSSSAVNKSGKKFAPKAPVRRPGAAAAASSTPAPTKPSVDSQNTSQTPQLAGDNVVPPPSSAEPVNTSTTTSEDTHEPDIHQPDNVSQTKSSSTETATPIPIPTPKPKPSLPTSEAASNGPQQSIRPSAASESVETPISIPIPTSKNKLSISTSESVTVEPSPSTPQPSPQAHSASTAETVDSQPQDGLEAPTSTRKRQGPQGPSGDNQSSVAAGVSPSQDDPTPVRPAKRIKVSEAAAPAGRTESVPPPITSPPNTQLETTQTQSETATPAASKKGRKATKPRKKRTAVEGDGEAAADTTEGRRKRSRKRREPTPEDAELVEIVPTVVKMSELCKDIKTGKKSKREMELRNMELAESERKQKEKEEGRKAGTPIKQNAENGGSLIGDEVEPPQKKPQAGPRMRIVNGEIVIDTASLQVDRHADASRDAGELEDVVENNLTRKINQASYGKRTKTESWDEEMTDLFYRGLRMFGTDFMMISKMFPGRSRRQIKLKFNNEERRDPERIKQALMGPRETIDIATYSEMTNTVYDDPRVIQKELDEEKKRIEDQHAKEREAQEELLRNPVGGKDVIPSIEGGAHNHKARSRNAKKANTFKGGLGGGTEEILGSIDDLPISA